MTVLSTLSPLRRDQLERRLGRLCMSTQSGSAHAAPRHHRLLVWLGLLEQDPATRQTSAALDTLPWGPQDARFPRPERQDGIDAALPQAPVVHPGFFPPVLHLDPAERREHLEVNVHRYLGQLLLTLPEAAWRILSGPRVVVVDDATFVEMLTETSLGQFIHLGLDPADREPFSDYLTAEGTLARVDCSAVRADATLPGVHAAPTVTLLERREAGWCVRAIRCGEVVFTPADGAAWDLAKLFVLQGLNLILVTMVHLHLHLPGDVINAATQALLPSGHLLARLLRPHTALTLGLHEAVVHHRRSAIHNSQQEIYTPFPHTTEAIHDGIARSIAGIPGRSAFRPYRPEAVLIGTHTPYGRFRRSWFERIEAFVGEVLAELPEADPFIARWAGEIHRWLPGFPDEEAASDRGQLIRAVSLYIFTVSVCHTGDHHSYSSIPIEAMPMRIRTPSPDQVRPTSLDLDALVSREDHLRHRLCHRMFIEPCIVTTLAGADYNFSSPGATAAAARFRQDMADLDRQWASSGFPRSDQIAASVQY